MKKVRRESRIFDGKRFKLVLKSQRQEQGLPMSVLSQMSGVSTGAICLIENGKRLPRLDTAFRLIEALGYSSIEDFMRMP